MAFVSVAKFGFGCGFNRGFNRGFGSGLDVLILFCYCSVIVILFSSLMFLLLFMFVSVCVVLFLCLYGWRGPVGLPRTDNPDWSQGQSLAVNLARSANPD